MKEKLFCSNCKGYRNHKSLFETEKEGSLDNGYFQWKDKYLIVECQGCENISFLHIYGDTEMVEYDDEGNFDYYFNYTILPPYLEGSSEIKEIQFLPIAIKDIYTETISTLKSKSFILAAGGMRAIIEAVCNHLGIEEGNLGKRIDLLHKNGHLSEGESKRLHSIRFLGNDALHEMEKPKKDQLYILLDIINHLLSNLFINDKKINGKVDTVIDKYVDFCRLVQSKINKEIVGQKLSINELLGKSIRLINKEMLIKFKGNILNEIKEGKLDYLSLEKETKEPIYKIEKVPVIPFDW